MAAIFTFPNPANLLNNLFIPVPCPFISPVSPVFKPFPMPAVSPEIAIAIFPAPALWNASVDADTPTCMQT